MAAVRTGDDVGSPVDVHVGARLRAMRRAKRVTQAQLADALGITFQQVQKYENGANRISASKLYAACQALGIRVADLFEGLASPERPDGADTLIVEALVHDPELTRTVLSILSLDRGRRRIVAETIAALAEAN